jgi:hypothetical protein
VYQNLFLLLSVLALVLPSTAGAAVDAPTPVPRFESVARCSWDRPGHNPFMGEVVPAIDRYVDIPTLVRKRLKERMHRRDYDELVEIRRDAIVGKHVYRPEIRDMHFGLDRVCREVSRSGWSEAMRERALVYCESGHCILVPTVCRNVSRVDRVLPLAAAESLDREPSIEVIEFAPPGAGRRPTDTSSFAESVAGESLVPPFSVDELPPIAAMPTGLPPLGTPGVPYPAPGDPPLGERVVDVPGSVVPYVPPYVPPLAGGGVVTPVPEPATWTSLLGGLAALALVARRRRQGRTGAPRCATQKRS